MQIKINLPTDRVLDCGHFPTVPRYEFTTGYAVESDTGRRICYACAGAGILRTMIATGRATLYVTERATEAGGATMHVGDWGSAFTFTAYSCRRAKRGGGFGSQRTDVWFTGPDGKRWHGVNRGDSQILICKRMADQPLAFTRVGARYNCRRTASESHTFTRREAIAYARANGFTRATF